VKGKGWMIKPEHQPLIDAVADELYDESKPHRLVGLLSVHLACHRVSSV
jgi:hypothetical protein